MSQKVTLQLGVQLTGYRQQLAKMKKAFEGVDFNTNFGRKLKAMMTRYGAELDKAEERLAAGLDSDYAIKGFESNLRKMAAITRNLFGNARDMSVGDILFPPDVQARVTALRKEINRLTKEQKALAQAGITSAVKKDDGFANELSKVLKSNSEAVRQSQANQLLQQLSARKKALDSQRNDLEKQARGQKPLRQRRSEQVRKQSKARLETVQAEITKKQDNITRLEAANEQAKQARNDNKGHVTHANLAQVAEQKRQAATQTQAALASQQAVQRTWESLSQIAKKMAGGVQAQPEAAATAPTGTRQRGLKDARFVGVNGGTGGAVVNIANAGDEHSQPTVAQVKPVDLTEIVKYISNLEVTKGVGDKKFRDYAVNPLADDNPLKPFYQAKIKQAQELVTDIQKATGVKTLSKSGLTVGDLPDDLRERVYSLYAGTSTPPADHMMISAIGKDFTTKNLGKTATLNSMGMALLQHLGMKTSSLNTVMGTVNKQSAVHDWGQESTAEYYKNLRKNPQAAPSIFNEKGKVQESLYFSREGLPTRQEDWAKLSIDEIKTTLIKNASESALAELKAITSNNTGSKGQLLAAGRKELEKFNIAHGTSFDTGANVKSKNIMAEAQQLFGVESANNIYRAILQRDDELIKAIGLSPQAIDNIRKKAGEKTTQQAANVQTAEAAAQKIETASQANQTVEKNTAEIAQLKSEITKLEAEKKALSSQIKEDNDLNDEYDKRDELNEKLDANAQATKELVQINQKVAQIQGEASKDIEKQITSQQKELDDIQQRALSQQIQSTQTQGQQIASNVSNYQAKAFQGTEQARIEIQESQEAARVSENIRGVTERLVGSTAIMYKITQLVRSAWNEIKSLDEAITGIAVVTDQTAAGLWDQIGAYTAVAKEYGVTTAGVYQVSQLYYQMGLGASEVTSLTAETLKMARIAGLDYGTATNYMAAALNGFKLQASEANQIVDTYSALAATAATTTSELAVAMSKTASIAEASGMSLASTSAMLTMMIG